MIVDNTDPTVAFTTPVDLGFVNAADADPFTVVADAADLGSGVDDVEFFLCTAGGVACTTSSSLGTDVAGPYEAAWSLPGADGVYHLKATARDLAGRSASSVVEVTVDRTTPDTTLVTTPGDPSRDSTPDFTFSSSEAGSTFECSVDGGAWTACTTPHTTAPLADGPRTFDVRAIDAAGNIDATPSSWAWLLDTTPPTATMNDPGANLRLDGRADLRRERSRRRARPASPRSSTSTRSPTRTRGSRRPLPGTRPRSPTASTTSAWS